MQEVVGAQQVFLARRMNRLCQNARPAVDLFGAVLDVPIRATDPDGASADQSLVISVGDVNETPTKMARTPARVTNVSRRFAERGEGGIGCSGRRGPSFINSWMIVRGAISRRRHTYTRTLANFPPNHCYICVMVTGAPKPLLGTRCARDPRCGLRC